PRTRGLVSVHFFGFPQNTPALRRWCDDRDLLFFEDCAHAFFGQAHGRPVGSYGHYAISSNTKFLPVYDGGVLTSAERSLDDIDMESPSWLYELKSLVNVVEFSVGFGRLGLARHLFAGLTRVKDAAWGVIKRARPQVTSTVKPSLASEGSSDFDPDWMSRAPSRWGQLLSAHIGAAGISATRVANYDMLHERLADAPGARPLFGEWPPGAVPQVYPLLLEKPGPVFDQLKREGVPIIRYGDDRWDGPELATCPWSTQLADSVLQFPVHQDLRPDELRWIGDRVVAALEQA
ncbi:MAG: DegT/DnrJ/EryC1/StrS family aminotransferase, partial [Acidimicrobiia bacterium]|nr:DegT/DnrJ/EryC1/StrS family aminotransferase [Acidimicrobiia bacterium]